MKCMILLGSLYSTDEPEPSFSLLEVIFTASSWCGTVLGLAFLIFLPVTMITMLFLPVQDFRAWILTQHYLESLILVAALLNAGLFRKGLQDSKGIAGFTTALLLMFTILWSAAEIWTHARLPY